MAEFLAAEVEHIKRGFGWSAQKVSYRIGSLRARHAKSLQPLSTIWRSS